MKKPVVSLVLTVLLALGANALATVTTDADLNAPTWRGGDGSTLQMWFFDQSQNPAAPDVDQNPFGDTSLSILGQDPVWIPDDQGRLGVWLVDRSKANDMVIDVPNSKEPNPFKDIWLQLVFKAAEDRAPNIYVLPEGSAQQPVPRMTLVQTTVLQDGYIHATYSLTIEPNPTWEKIYIRPRDCEVLIDSVVVDTQCIPEPMTLAMLGLGSLLLRLRRKQ